MAKAKKTFNPFYVPLVVLGVAFTISASLYCIVILRSTDSPYAVESSETVAAGKVAADNRLIDFMSNHGEMVLGVQILLLAVATFGAIATDRYWARRHESSARSQATPRE